MKITIINGPNLNLIGKREPEKYGNISFEEYFIKLKNKNKTIDLEYFQSNIEGEIIDELQRIGFQSDGIILNAGGYTHTSVAIRDAIASITSPVVEVHITNVQKREDFRHFSLLTSVCTGIIAGFGLFSYDSALAYFTNKM